MDWIKIGPSLLTLTLALGCGSDDDPSGATDGGTDGSSSGSTSSTSTTSTTTSTTSTSTSTSTTTTTSTSTTTDATGGSSTGATQGTCIGFDTNGYVNSVLGLDGANVGGSCDDVPAACGGDPTGVWTVQNSCGEENTANLYGAICPGATQQVQNLNTIGTITFNANGTYEQMTTATSDVQIDIDVQGCLGATCMQFETLLDAENGITASCSGADTDCQCDLEIIAITNVMGTYAVNGNDLELTIDGDTSVVPFCISGGGNDRMDFWLPQYQPELTTEVCEDATDCETALGDQNEFYFCDVEEGMGVVHGPRLAPRRP